MATGLTRLIRICLHSNTSSIDKVDQNIFKFKQLVHNYIQDNEENHSRKSSKNSKSKKSSVSSGSRSSGSSTSMKEQAIKEKMRLADLNMK